MSELRKLSLALSDIDICDLKLCSPDLLWPDFRHISQSTMQVPKVLIDSAKSAIAKSAINDEPSKTGSSHSIRHTK